MTYIHGPKTSTTSIPQRTDDVESRRKTLINAANAGIPEVVPYGENFPPMLKGLSKKDASELKRKEVLAFSKASGAKVSRSNGSVLAAVAKSFKVQAAMAPIRVLVPGALGVTSTGARTALNLVKGTGQTAVSAVGQQLVPKGSEGRSIAPTLNDLRIPAEMKHKAQSMLKDLILVEQMRQKNGDSAVTTFDQAKIDSAVNQFRIDTENELERMIRAEKDVDGLTYAEDRATAETAIAAAGLAVDIVAKTALRVMLPPVLGRFSALVSLATYPAMAAARQVASNRYDDKSIAAYTLHKYREQVKGNGDKDLDDAAYAELAASVQQSYQSGADHKFHARRTEVFEPQLEEWELARKSLDYRLGEVDELLEAKTRKEYDLIQAKHKCKADLHRCAKDFGTSHAASDAQVIENLLLLAAMPQDALSNAEFDAVLRQHAVEIQNLSVLPQEHPRALLKQLEQARRVRDETARPLDQFFEGGVEASARKELSTIVKTTDEGSDDDKDALLRLKELHSNLATAKSMQKAKAKYDNADTALRTYRDEHGNDAVSTEPAFLHKHEKREMERVKLIDARAKLEKEVAQYQVDMDHYDKHQGDQIDPEGKLAKQILSNSHGTKNNIRRVLRHGILNEIAEKVTKTGLITAAVDGFIYPIASDFFTVGKDVSSVIRQPLPAFRVQDIDDEIEQGAMEPGTIADGRIEEKALEPQAPAEEAPAEGDAQNSVRNARAAAPDPGTDRILNSHKTLLWLRDQPLSHTDSLNWIRRLQSQMDLTKGELAEVEADIEKLTSELDDIDQAELSDADQAMGKLRRKASSLKAKVASYRTMSNLLKTKLSYATAANDLQDLRTKRAAIAPLSELEAAFQHQESILEQAAADDVTAHDDFWAKNRAVEQGDTPENRAALKSATTKYNETGRARVAAHKELDIKKKALADARALDKEIEDAEAAAARLDDQLDSYRSKLDLLVLASRAANPIADNPLEYSDSSKDLQRFIQLNKQIREEGQWFFRTNPNLKSWEAERTTLLNKLRGAHDQQSSLVKQLSPQEELKLIEQLRVNYPYNQAALALFKEDLKKFKTHRDGLVTSLNETRKSIQFAIANVARNDLEVLNAKAAILQNQIGAMNARITELETIVTEGQADLDLWTDRLDQYDARAIELVDEISASSSGDERADLESQRIELEKKIRDQAGVLKSAEKTLDDRRGYPSQNWAALEKNVQDARTAHTELVRQHGALLLQIKDAAAKAELSDKSTKDFSNSEWSAPVQGSVLDAFMKYRFAVPGAEPTDLDTKNFLDRLNASVKSPTNA